MESPAPKNCLPITGLEIPDIDIESPLASVKYRLCEDYDDAYSEAAAGTENVEGKALFRSLAIICSFYPQYGNSAEPYRAATIWGNKRSSIPDDLSEADVDMVAELLSLAKDASLRARLADILWLKRRREHQAARGAVADYLLAAQGLLEGKRWRWAVDLFLRAVQLASKLGRDKPEHQRAVSALLGSLEHPKNQSEPLFAGQFLHLILALDLGDAMDLAEISKHHAELPALNDDPEGRRFYLLLEADFRLAAEDSDREAEARMQAADTYIEEGEIFAKRNPPCFMSASDSVAKGIEALRQALAPDSRITELKARLRTYQKAALTEMQTFRIPVDTKESCEASAQHVTDDDFRRAMLKLAMGPPVLVVDDLRQSVIDDINNAPLQGLMPEKTVDAEGRVVAQKKSLLGLVGEEAEQELEKKMFESAAGHAWKWRARTFIAPARWQIWQQHSPSMRDLEYLVRHNPLIPPGHEGIYLQGLYYGLAGDFMIASHLIAPQIENSIRYVLQQNGVDISILDSDLIQKVKTLGALLAMPETERIFGKDCCYEMRGLLIEKHGYAFRNNIAHGFVTQNQCYSDAALNVWWFVLRLFHCTLFSPEEMNEGQG